MAHIIHSLLMDIQAFTEGTVCCVVCRLVRAEKRDQMLAAVKSDQLLMENLVTSNKIFMFLIESNTSVSTRD